MIKKEELLKELKKKNVYTDNVKKALEQAEKSHGEQDRDDGGGVLEEHIYAVAFSILQRFEKESFLEDLVVLALLHDTIEDDDDFDIEKCNDIFGSGICKNVQMLTKDERQLRAYSGDNLHLYELLKYFCNRDYLEAVNGSNEVCKIVKLEDRINNLQSIKKIGDSIKNLRYVIEADTLFMDMAKKIKSFDYIPLLKKEISRLSSYAPKTAT